MTHLYTSAIIPAIWTRSSLSELPLSIESLRLRAYSLSFDFRMLFSRELLGKKYHILMSPLIKQNNQLHICNTIREPWFTGESLREALLGQHAVLGDQVDGHVPLAAIVDGVWQKVRHCPASHLSAYINTTVANNGLTLMIMLLSADSWIEPTALKHENVSREFQRKKLQLYQTSSPLLAVTTMLWRK